MAAKTSPEMLRAIELVKKGATAYRAAKECNVTTSAVTRSKGYRDHVAANFREVHERTPMERAQVMIEGGATAYEAAKICGVSQSSISRSKWYRDHMAANIAAGFGALAADALNNLKPGA